MKKVKKKAVKKNAVKKKLLDNPVKSAKKPAYSIESNVKGSLRVSKLQKNYPDLWRDVSNMKIWDTLTFTNDIKSVVTNFKNKLESKGLKFELIKQTDEVSKMRRLSSRQASIRIRKKKGE